MVISYDDEFVDFASRHVALIAQLDAKISDYHVRSAFTEVKLDRELTSRSFRDPGQSGRVSIKCQ